MDATGIMGMLYDEDDDATLARAPRPPARLWAGGPPSKGTPADRRLQSNKSQPPRPAPKPSKGK